MTFLAPWALAIGGLGAASLVALHLVSRYQPAAFMLPTARFIPDHRTLVSRRASTPSDLLLLLVRVVLLLSAATAFAKPVLTPRRGSVAQIILVDRSSAVADMREVSARLKAASNGMLGTIVVLFDTSAALVTGVAADSAVQAAMSSARGAQGSSLAGAHASGSISPALLVARRAAIGVADDVDSLRLVLVSPVAASELDSATRVLRAMWPGAISIERVALRADSSQAWSLESALPLSDLLGPSLAAQRVKRVGARQTRLVRSAPGATDSAFARSGGTVVVWDSASVSATRAEGLSAGGDVVVAALKRRDAGAAGNPVARWADGTPAAMEQAVGAGCIRRVGIGIPGAGDVSLHPPFQRIVRRLLAPCGVRETVTPADSSAVAMLRGGNNNLAAAATLRNNDHRMSRLVQALLVLALVCAGAEVFLRARTREQAPA